MRPGTPRYHTKLRELDGRLTALEQAIVQSHSRSGWTYEAHLECEDLHRQAGRLWIERKILLALLEEGEERPPSREE